MVSTQRQGIEPELADGAIPLHVDVLRFLAVEAEEEEPVWTRDVVNRGRHAFRARSLPHLNGIIHVRHRPRALTMSGWDRRASPNEAGHGCGALWGASAETLAGTSSQTMSQRHELGVGFAARPNVNGHGPYEEGRSGVLG